MAEKIQWHEWGAEALALAQQQNKPIFLSIGYFTCYWCHVVEHEAYQDPDFITLLNRECIAIKVDKDERPDIDEIYLYARQLITKQSGWPNHLLLTPQGDPFLAMGVLRNGKDGTIASKIEAVIDRWKDAHEQVSQAAQQISAVIAQHFQSSEASGDGTPDRNVADVFFNYLTTHYDAEYGGFYAEPKFPHETYLQFLLAYARDRDNEQARDMAAESMKKMAAGGIFDHVGGGFHRYAIGRDWQVPHFEKMLYNQALQGLCYAELYTQRGKQYHYDIAEKTFNFALNTLRDPGGAFFAAIDAETDGIEGAYYTWTEAEIASILSPKQQELFAKCYGIAEVPTQPGHKAMQGGVLYARRHLMALAEEKGRSYEALKNDLYPLLATLKKARDQRSAPELDRKIITAWNGLMIDALARASDLLEKPEYLQAAIQAAEFILSHMRIDGNYLARLWKNDHAASHGYLQDYAYMEAALLSLYRFTHDDKWLTEAISLHRLTDQRFWDSADGGYFMTDGSEDLLVRIHRGHDTGLPSASGVMLKNLMQLYDLTDDEGWLARARVIMAAYHEPMQKMPADFSTMLQAVLYLYRWE